MNSDLRPGKAHPVEKYPGSVIAAVATNANSIELRLAMADAWSRGLRFIGRARATAADKLALVFEKLKLYSCARIDTDRQDTNLSTASESLSLIAMLLREPASSTRRLLTRNAIYLERLQASYNRRVPRNRLIKHCSEFRLRQRQAYLNLLRDDERSRILAAYHFGDYVYGMNTLVCLENPERKRYVLSQRAASGAYFENLRLGLGNRAIDKSAELLTTDTNAAELSRLLRGGNTTLALYCDLPAGFGERVEVNFLGRRAMFPKGPAMLAISNKAPLLPVINYNDGEYNRIELGKQIEPRLNCDESLQAGVIRITQQLIVFFEHYFYKHPEQWRYLKYLPAYYLDK